MRYLLTCMLSIVLLLHAGHLHAAQVSQDIVPHLQSVQADFVQEKHLKILAHPIRSTGRFVFQAPSSLRWEYRQPVRSLLLMNNGVIKKFGEQQGKLVEEHGMPLDTMQVVLAEINNWIEGRFTNNSAFSVSRRKEGIIILTPRQPTLATFIQQIKLEQGDRPGLLRSVTIVEGTDAFTRLTFRHAILNHPVPTSLFTAP